jgi:histidine ammonia-lyase
LKLRQVVENVEHVLAIELMCAAQGLDFRLPLKAGRRVHDAYLEIRQVVSHLDADRVLAPDIEAVAGLIRRGSFDSWL